MIFFINFKNDNIIHTCIYPLMRVLKSFRNTIFIANDVIMVSQMLIKMSSSTLFHANYEKWSSTIGRRFSLQIYFHSIRWNLFCILLFIHFTHISFVFFCIISIYLFWWPSFTNFFLLFYDVVQFVVQIIYRETDGHNVRLIIFFCLT